MPEPSYLERICPVCGSNAIEQGNTVLCLRSSLFRCASCGTPLKVRFTKRMLLGMVVTMLTLTAIGCLPWLHAQIELPPWAWAGLLGGVGGGGMAYALKLIARGMVFSSGGPLINTTVAV